MSAAAPPRAGRRLDPAMHAAYVTMGCDRPRDTEER